MRTRGRTAGRCSEGWLLGSVGLFLSRLGRLQKEKPDASRAKEESVPWEGDVGATRQGKRCSGGVRRTVRKGRLGSGSGTSQGLCVAPTQPIDQADVPLAARQSKSPAQGRATQHWNNFSPNASKARQAGYCSSRSVAGLAPSGDAWKVSARVSVRLKKSRRWDRPSTWLVFWKMFGLEILYDLVRGQHIGTGASLLWLRLQLSAGYA